MNKEKSINLELDYKETIIKAILIYRERKNITIEIKPKDKIKIISPLNIPRKNIEQLVINKGDWILKKLDEYKNMDDFNVEKEYKNGEKFYYLGKEYTLVINKVNNNRLNPQVYIENNNIIIKTYNIDEEYIKENLKKWYKKESERVILDRLQRCREYSPIMMKLNPRSIKVKEQKKRWGSCTSKRDIYINSKIVMARPSSIDYILIHEFSHLVHMNHSKDFYNLVESIMPEYKKEEKWLKLNSYKLFI
ncbi:MAG: M48 family metallopeptidase [Peptostreptococcaceae bacterium]